MSDQSNHARDDVPWLLTALRAAQSEIADANSALERSGICGIYDEFGNLADAIEQMTTYVKALEAAGAQPGSWKQLAMQAMRFLTADQIVAATKAAGLSSNICKR